MPAMLDNGGASSGDQSLLRHRRDDIPPPMPAKNRALHPVHRQTPLSQIVKTPIKNLHIERFQKRFLLFRHKPSVFFLIAQNAFAVKIPQECRRVGRKALADGNDFRGGPGGPHAYQGKLHHLFWKSAGEIKSQGSAHGPTDKLDGIKMLFGKKGQNPRLGSGRVQRGHRSYPRGRLFCQIENLSGKSPSGQKKDRRRRQWFASPCIAHPTLRHHCSGVDGLIPEGILILQKPTVGFFNALPQRNVRLPAKFCQL